ncbi:exopolysaccharide biosynthesis protein [Rhodobacterales bacterium HKCCE2091]|nr:exopolysaccharide biosynthesis protein [Rhodobacterales bacterium HKCCE2091]
MTDAPDRNVEQIVQAMRDAAHGETATIGDLLDEIGKASFVPILLAPALAVVTPLSGVPLVSSICGLLILILSAQLLFGRRHLWIPDFVLKRELPSDKLKKAAGWLDKPGRWLDRHTHRRMTVLVKPPFDRIIYATCMLCGAAMPVFELVPFTSSILGAAVALLSLTLLVRDGLLATIAYAAIIGAAVTVAVVLT